MTNLWSKSCKQILCLTIKLDQSLAEKDTMYKYLKLLILPLMFFSSSWSWADDSVLKDPSPRVINPPLRLRKDRSLEIHPPWKKAPRPPQRIAECLTDHYWIQVEKDHTGRRARIEDLSEEPASPRTVSSVKVQKLTKDMLGQYSAAVVIAQQLGLTEVESIKFIYVDPQPSPSESKVLVYFLDDDDEPIDRTLIFSNRWVRCKE